MSLPLFPPSPLKVLILADKESDDTIRRDVERPASDLGFSITRVYTLREALSALGVAGDGGGGGREEGVKEDVAAAAAAARQVREEMGGGEMGVGSMTTMTTSAQNQSSKRAKLLGEDKYAQTGEEGSIDNGDGDGDDLGGGDDDGDNGGHGHGRDGGKKSSSFAPVMYDVVVSKLGRRRRRKRRSNKEVQVRAMRLDGSADDGTASYDSDSVLDEVSGLDLLRAVRLFFGRRVFFIVHRSAACSDPMSRWTMFQSCLVLVDTTSSGGGGEMSASEPLFPSSSLSSSSSPCAYSPGSTTGGGAIGIKEGGHSSPLRLVLAGCNMVSTDRAAIETALWQIRSASGARRGAAHGPASVHAVVSAAKRKQGTQEDEQKEKEKQVGQGAIPSSYACPWCGLDGFDERGLLTHCPLYHTNEEDRTYRTKHPLLEATLSPTIFGCTKVGVGVGASNGGSGCGGGIVNLRNFSPPRRNLPDHPLCCPICSSEQGHRLMDHLHRCHGPPPGWKDDFDDNRKEEGGGGKGGNSGGDSGDGVTPPSLVTDANRQRYRKQKQQLRWQCQWQQQQQQQKINAFSLVVCIHGDRILLVQERSNAGYWLPGGHVDNGETLKSAAIRETLEEAGVDVELTGVLKIQYRPYCTQSNRRGDDSKGKDKDKNDANDLYRTVVDDKDKRKVEYHVRMRVIFLARLKRLNDYPYCKTLPDYESCGAVWVAIEDVLNGRIPLRSPEPYTWLKYLRVDDGTVHSLDVLSDQEC